MKKQMTSLCLPVLPNSALKHVIEQVNKIFAGTNFCEDNMLNNRLMISL
jgi:hypothetical protein